MFNSNLKKSNYEKYTKLQYLLILNFKFTFGKYPTRDVLNGMKNEQMFYLNFINQFEFLYATYNFLAFLPVPLILQLVTRSGLWQKKKR